MPRPSLAGTWAVWADLGRRVNDPVATLLPAEVARLLSPEGE